MNAKTKLYVGIKPGYVREVFRAAIEPTWDTHGQTYLCVIGPFRTKPGALFMRDYGGGNPHCRNVTEAERLARQYHDRAKLAHFES